MARYGMVIDTRKCVGCYACRVSCQMQNELPVEESYIKFYEKETGVFPNVKNEIIPVQCQHCEDAPCVSVCPTKATYTTAEGIVLVDSDKCIGCKYCMVACHYGARTQDHKTGVVEKCRFCAELVAEGKQPACVSTCISNARIFGDLDDPNSEVSKAIVKMNAQPLRPDLGKAKIYYVR
ncbi:MULTISPECIES: 4Fe-4S dicluster domain-containing protein [Mesobacillus]|uniref:4Fe-4S dicluster domain-containing protein n=1 Tax=Mesobacillus selenatarsenatis TaxID=388741 RepID=A0A846THP9_9BACI|nr:MULTISPECIES: 4Fe-4S dicluster domain-containing protein [Mesobacillus]NKE06470.1 4Fe-4S dicluster domain-containing protein [Mesobacillus selenatarsenatis]